VVLELPEIYGRKFETGGWDVVFCVLPAGLFLKRVSLPACVCVCDHEADCPGAAPCRGGDQRYGCKHNHADRFVPTLEQWQEASTLEQLALRRQFNCYAHCNPECAWREGGPCGPWLLDDEERTYRPQSLTVRLELKPDLGDDFPSVLRQVVSHEVETGDRRCVLVRRHSFEHVTWEQVKEIFSTAAIALISEADLST
jgi:hypothetical protein